MSSLERATEILRQSTRVVAFTGAGLSTESGIPDFRSPGGIWSKYDPEEFAFPRFVSNTESRKKYWAWGLEFYPKLRDAEPNAAHRALAELESRGKLRCLITQNIDDLHHRAGSREVIELHGNATRVGCLRCKKEWPREVIQERLVAGDQDPRCDECGSITKPKTISFGQSMPEPQTSRAFEEARTCDALICAGSSLVVFPAAAIVPEAKRNGAKLIIVNLAPTDYDEIADVVIHGKAGETLPAIVGSV